jgi:hypothetical protein
VSDIGRKSAATEAESALRAHLERSLRTRFEANPCKPHCWYYYGSYDFVLREGRFFTPDARLEDTRGANSGHSFLNSLRNAAAKRLSYIEGYAVNESSLIPVLHAWNSDDDGFVVDATWHPPGIAYFGVLIPHALVFAARHQEGSVGSLIDNWRQQWPLLRRPWSKTLAERAP